MAGIDSLYKMGILDLDCGAKYCDECKNYYPHEMEEAHKRRHNNKYKPNKEL